MKLAVASEHRDYFQKNHFIEFEGLLNADQVSLLRQGIDAGLAKSVRLPVAKLSRLTAEKKFSAGRDLWRLDENVKKWVTHSQLAEIASELIEKKPLRLGFDQYFPATPSHENIVRETAYDHLLSQTVSLNAISCLQGVLCGLILSLTDGAEAEPDASIFPRKAGNGIYFQPTHPFDFSQLRKRGGEEFLLIVYCEKISIYIMREGDPQGHALKRLGYVFGDKLSDKLNPVLYR